MCEPRAESEEMIRNSFDLVFQLGADAAASVLDAAENSVRVSFFLFYRFFLVSTREIEEERSIGSN